MLRGRMTRRRGYRRRVIGDETARLRKEYEAKGLVEGEMAPSPVEQFREWFAGASDAGIDQPNAFVLATVDEDGTPSARAVLLKDLGHEGLVFYTGLSSRKSRALRQNGKAAATFVWTPIHRQVRFEGTATPVPATVADAYFATRPRGAQIAAHASRQSEVVADRETLDVRFERLSREFGEGPVPRPEHWGGWSLRPESVEFWQGQPNRFHDRVRYQRDDQGWRLERLSP